MISIARAKTKPLPEDVITFRNQNPFVRGMIEAIENDDMRAFLNCLRDFKQMGAPNINARFEGSRNKFGFFPAGNGKYDALLGYTLQAKEPNRQKMREALIKAGAQPPARRPGLI
jgi:hypothetical protein